MGLSPAEPRPPIEAPGTIETEYDPPDAVVLVERIRAEVARRADAVSPR